MAEDKDSKEMIFGEFWQINPNGEITFYHYGWICFLIAKGFFWFRQGKSKHLVKTDGKVLRFVDIGDVSIFTHSYINQLTDNLGNGATRRDLLNLIAKGIDVFLGATKLRLLPVREIVFCNDTKTEGFFFFKNTAVKVNSEGIELLPLNGMEGFIWKEQIIPKEFSLIKEPTECEYELFCQRICDNDKKKFHSLKSILGYLLHSYWKPSLTLIPIFIDLTSRDTETANGGTGKTLLCLGLSEIKKMITIDGKKFDPSSAFAWQRAEPGTQLITIDDPHKNFSLEALFSVVSTGLEVNRKHKAEFKFEKGYIPKFIITSNFPVKSVAGNSTQRRKLEFEIGDYYGAHLRPSDEFGHDLFVDWDSEEYNRHFNFLLNCLQQYLTEGITLPVNVNSERRNMETQVGIDLVEFLQEKIDEGMRRFNKVNLYNEFLNLYKGQRNFYPSPNRFSRKVHVFLNFYYKDLWEETPKRSKKFIELDLPLSESESVEINSNTMSFEDAMKLASGENLESSGSSENYITIDIDE